MPNNFSVNLDVRNSASSGSDGYTNTTASNGSVYSYKYSGGNGGGGDVNVPNAGGHNANAAITVTMNSDPRYSITNVGFVGDTLNQFAWHAGGQASVAVITDTNSAAASVKYTCTVTDSTANCTMPCDPIIKNEPPGK
jgi:hypothetical protein